MLLTFVLMKVLIDHQIFTSQRYGGISRYFANLNSGLNNLPGVNGKIAALYSENEYIKNNGPILNNALGKKLFHNHHSRLKRWNERYSNLNIKLDNFDIFHPTYYDTYFIKQLKKPFVVTIHDMIHELYPHYFTDSAEIINRKKTLIGKASALIAISAHTRNEIIKFYPDAENKISIIHHGYLPVLPANAGLTPHQQFILFVGDRTKYKNFDTFISAISNILKADKELTLICAGGGSFSVAEKAFLSANGIGDKCSQINATDTDLQVLYQTAQIFVFPSLQEGFGLPLLEAFANRCPVACSNTTSLPEIAGDAAIYFDPYDILSMRTAINNLLYNETIKEELKNRGQQHLSLFSFDNCINNTLQVYQSV